MPDGLKDDGPFCGMASRRTAQDQHQAKQGEGHEGGGFHGRQSGKFTQAETVNPIPQSNEQMESPMIWVMESCPKVIIAVIHPGARHAKQTSIGFMGFSQLNEQECVVAADPVAPAEHADGFIEAHAAVLTQFEIVHKSLCLS